MLETVSVQKMENVEKIDVMTPGGRVDLAWHGDGKRERQFMLFVLLFMTSDKVITI